MVEVIFSLNTEQCSLDNVKLDNSLDNVKHCQKSVLLETKLLCPHRYLVLRFVSEVCGYTVNGRWLHVEVLTYNLLFH